jgi:XTP/dITP diphosphohydrolase
LVAKDKNFNYFGGRGKQGEFENAILKARHACRLTQKPALADDSGLVVSALHGQPGIYSARFAGEQASDADNIELLLQKIQMIPEHERHAYFYCAIALVRAEDDPAPLIATGHCHGLIQPTCAGDKGFGYDPIFYLPEHHCTMAQLSLEIKNRISHRAMALQQLWQALHN